MKTADKLDILDGIDDKFITEAFPHRLFKIGAVPKKDKTAIGERHPVRMIESFVSVAAIFLVIGMIFVWTLVGKDIMQALKGEDTHDVTTTAPQNNDSSKCKHKWEKADNLNEYTAVEKCSLCNTTRIYTDRDSITYSGIETGFMMLRHNWDGYSIGRKEVKDCDLGYAILDCLSKLSETGEVIPKISDDIIDEFSKELPTERGTVWLECGSVGLFRLDPSMTEICKVETHLGEGTVLKMTDTLEELLKQAWYYHPNDYWSGSYENGKITLNQLYKNTSAVEWLEIEKIFVENIHHAENNKITLRIEGAQSKTVKVKLQCYQSYDNLSIGDSKEIELISGEETIVELKFGGFYNHTYQLSITIDNTRINLTIDPKDA